MKRKYTMLLYEGENKAEETFTIFLVSQPITHP